MARSPLARRAPLVGVVLAVVLFALPAAAAPPPNDPLVPQQTHHPVVGTFDAWDVRRGEGAVVAVLDTGVDLDHPDLTGRLVEGIDLVDRGTPPDDPQGHGTIVAGIIVATADNGRGVAGVAPQARVMPIRVLDERGRGTSDVVAEGIRHAIAQQVEVINLSLAEVRSADDRLQLSLVRDPAVRDAIDEAAESGIVVVAAAGNDGGTTTPYEADAPLIVVGATTAEDQVWEESNVDDRTLLAPGVDVLSTWFEGRYAKADGTSFATPIVAAGAAMLTGAGMPQEEVVERLVSTAVDVGAGLGRVDLAAAVQGVEAAPTPTTTPIPPPTDLPPSDPPPPPPPPPPDGGALEVVEPVAEVPPATQVTEPQPPIATIPSDAVASPLAPPSVPSTPVAVTPAPMPAPSATAIPGPLVVDDGGVAERDVPIAVAGALVSADIALAGWVLARRRRQSR